MSNRLQINDAADDCPIITEVRFIHGDGSCQGPVGMTTVEAIFNTGKSCRLFRYRPDEYEVLKGELIGMTRKESEKLKRLKDEEFLKH